MPNQTAPGKIRVTFHTDPDLHRQAKIAAVHRGVTLSDLITKALRRELATDQEEGN